MVFVNPADIEALGLADGARVDLISEWTAPRRTGRAACQGLPRRPVLDAGGNAAAYYPETNPLIPLDHVAAKSNTPVSKAIVDPAGAGTWGSSAAGAQRVGRVTARRQASHVTAEGVFSRPETLAVEEPLEIRLNGTAITVTMRTPGDDFDLAQGFCSARASSASATTSPASQYCVRRRADAIGDGNTYNVLDVTLAPGVPLPDLDVTRNFYTTSSCGVCGKASLDAVRTSPTSPGDDPTTVPPTSCSAMPDRCAPRNRSSTAPAACTPPRCSTPTAPCSRPRGRRPPQRRRQGGRLGAAAPPPAAARHRAAGQRPRLLRARAEGRDGRHPDARGGLRAVSLAVDLAASPG